MENLSFSGENNTLNNYNVFYPLTHQKNLD